MDARLKDLVELADFNGLLRAVDGLCDTRRWDELVELAEACEAALDRGKQLWPIADHIDYRLALEAPGEYAAEVLTHRGGRFSHGPLTEVAASTHTWEELAPHVELPEIAAYVAHERVLRGEDLEHETASLPAVLDLPLKLTSWEPTYALATFKTTFVEVAEPWDVSEPAEVERTGWTELERDEAVPVLLDLVQPWVAESNGAARAIAVAGDATMAASSLTLDHLRMAAITPEEAVQRIAWAAASGGARGRRRGAAFGRFLAWYTCAALAGLDWPAHSDELGSAVAELRWFVFDEGEPGEGWDLRVAVEDPQHGWAAAIAASDVMNEEDDTPG